MLEHNRKMQSLLRKNGIECRVRYNRKGSMKGTWRLYQSDTEWTQELIDRLTDMGFTDFDWHSLNKFSGNGGMFSVYVTIEKSRFEELFNKKEQS